MSLPKQNDFTSREDNSYPIAAVYTMFDNIVQYGKQEDLQRLMVSTDLLARIVSAEYMDRYG